MYTVHTGKSLEQVCRNLHTLQMLGCGNFRQETLIDFQWFDTSTVRLRSPQALLSAGSAGHKFTIIERDSLARHNMKNYCKDTD